MALFNRTERKDGLQLGTLGDECMHCKAKNKGNEDYVPESLQYKEVYKMWVHNMSHCLCMDCFKKTLGDFILLDPNMQIEEEKNNGGNAKNAKAEKKESAAKKQSSKKEDEGAEQ